MDQRIKGEKMEKCAIITLATNKEYLRGAELLYITYLRY